MSLREIIVDADHQRAEWAHTHKSVVTEQEKQMYYRLFNRKLERWLDDCHGFCVLRDRYCAEIIANTMNHFDRQRYRLDHWVIMPNHIHALLLVLPGHSLKRILHSWKSFSANQINRYLAQHGTLWRSESFDCIVRNTLQLEKFRWYIIENAEKAKNEASLSVGKWDD